jgi:hypothetical protein
VAGRSTLHSAVRRKCLLSGAVATLRFCQCKARQIKIVGILIEQLGSGPHVIFAKSAELARVRKISNGSGAACS